MVIPILFKDEEILVISKPAGIVVNRSDTSNEGTVQDWIDDNNHVTFISDQEVKTPDGYDKAAEFKNRSGIVHRLDKETSGVLVIARTLEAFIKLQGQFKDRSTRKTYLALVHGTMSSSSGEIKAPIGRLPWNRLRFGVVPQGKESVTHFDQLETFRENGKDYSGLKLTPKTGRTHQLRVHLAYVGHPIVGDDLYSGRKRSRSEREWSGRLLLHAWKLEFSHPSTGKTLAFTAPIPDDMKRYFDHASG